MHVIVKRLFFLFSSFSFSPVSRFRFVSFGWMILSLGNWDSGIPSGRNHGILATELQEFAPLSHFRYVFGDVMKLEGV